MDSTICKVFSIRQAQVLVYWSKGKFVCVQQSLQCLEPCQAVGSSLANRFRSGKSRASTYPNGQAKCNFSELPKTRSRTQSTYTMKQQYEEIHEVCEVQVKQHQDTYIKIERICSIYCWRRLYCRHPQYMYQCGLTWHLNRFI